MAPMRPRESMRTYRGKRESNWNPLGAQDSTFDRLLMKSLDRSKIFESSSEREALENSKERPVEKSRSRVEISVSQDGGTFSPSLQSGSSSNLSTPSDARPAVFGKLMNKRNYSRGNHCFKKRNDRKIVQLPEIVKNKGFKDVVSDCCTVSGKGRGIIWSTPKIDTEVLCSPGLTPISRGRGRWESFETPLRRKKEQSSVFIVSRGSVVEGTVEACHTGSSLSDPGRSARDDSCSLVESSVDYGPLSRGLERLCLVDRASRTSSEDTYSQVRPRNKLNSRPNQCSGSDSSDFRTPPSSFHQDRLNGLHKAQSVASEFSSHKESSLEEGPSLESGSLSTQDTDTSVENISGSLKSLSTGAASPIEILPTFESLHDASSSCVNGSRAKLSNENQVGRWLRGSKTSLKAYQSSLKTDEYKVLRKSSALSCTSEESFDEELESSPRQSSVVSGGSLRPEESLGEEECEKMSLSSDSSTSMNDRASLSSQGQDLDHLRSPDASSLSSRSTNSPFLGFSSPLPLLPGMSGHMNQSDWTTRYAMHMIKTSQGTNIIKSKSTSSLRKQLDPTSPTPGRRGYPMKKCLSEGSWLNRGASSLDSHWEGSRSRSLTRHEPDRLTSPLPSVSEENQDESSDSSGRGVGRTFTILSDSEQHSGSQELGLPPLHELSFGDSENESVKDFNESSWSEREEVGGRSNHQIFSLDYIAEEEADEIDNLEPFPPTQERVFLMAGKKYRRSLSIMYQLSESQNMSICSNKGRAYENTVKQVITMQKRVCSGMESRRVSGVCSAASIWRGSPRRCSSLCRSLAQSRMTVSMMPSPLPESPSSPDASPSHLSLQPPLVSNPLANLINDFVIQEVQDEDPGEDNYEKLVKYLCGQSEPCSFDDILDDVEVNSVKKVGEGVYGEVFSYCRDERKLVLKVLPIKGEFKVNGEDQKDYFHIVDELLITKAMSDLDCEEWDYRCSGFIKLSRVWLICGAYPDTLISLWDKFDVEKESYNDRPTIFPEEQLYIGLELAHGGQDLESYKFSSASQSLSAFKQVVYSLAVGEASYEFEHRDLHWGNVLISRTTEKILYFQICNHEFQVKTNGVKATIIDYTLSRITMREDVKLFNDVSSDEDLFAGKGDIQFDVYRQMRDELKNDWSQHWPKTNVMWLNYLVQKLVDEAQYSRKGACVHQTSLATLRSIQSWIGSCSSAYSVAQKLTTI